MQTDLTYLPDLIIYEKLYYPLASEHWRWISLRSKDFLAKEDNPFHTLMHCTCKAEYNKFGFKE